MLDCNNNGWTYYTDIVPYNLPEKQNIQNIYLENYNSAFEILINELLVDYNKLNTHFNSINNKTNKLNNKYFITINCNDKNDIIKLNDYSLEFHKSKFINLKNKKIKQYLINYYKPLNLYVKGPFKLLKIVFR